MAAAMLITTLLDPSPLLCMHRVGILGPKDTANRCCGKLLWDLSSHFATIHTFFRSVGTVSAHRRASRRLLRRVTQRQRQQMCASQENEPHEDVLASRVVLLLFVLGCLVCVCWFTEALPVY